VKTDDKYRNDPESSNYLFYSTEKRLPETVVDESVSVVVPLYHANHVFFSRTLKSLVLQEHQVKEHIFVFDGWYENWAEIEILRHLPNAQLIKLERNMGQGSARNLGMKKSSCKWIAFLDQDDLWEPDHLSGLILGTRHGEFSLGYSDIKEIDVDGFVTEKSMMHNTVVLGMNNLIKKDISDLLFRDLMIFPTSVIVDRVKFNHVGGFAEVLKGHEDDFGFRKLLQEYPIHFYHNSVTASWRAHSSGTSASISMSESRLAYSKLLLSEFRDDLSIKKGISNRLSKSFLRELIGVASNHDKSLFDLYRRNCVAFLNVTRDLEAPTNFRYRIAFSLKYPLLLVLIVKILKFLRTFLIAPKVRHEFKFTLINPVFPIVKVIKFLGRRIGETK
jgi:glycosyltransferase involved in cell wall biosynthesis